MKEGTSMAGQKLDMSAGAWGGHTGNWQAKEYGDPALLPDFGQITFLFICFI